MGCKSNSIEIKKFLPNKKLEKSKLIFSSKTMESFVERIKHDSNCVLYSRKYHELIVSKYGSKKKVNIPSHKFNYKICLKSNKLYYSDNIDKQEHVILSTNNWIVDGVNCKIKIAKKDVVLQKQLDILEVNCNNGDYSIFAKNIGLIESGNKNIKNNPEIKLKSIK